MSEQRPEEKADPELLRMIQKVDLQLAECETRLAVLQVLRDELLAGIRARKRWTGATHDGVQWH